MPSSVILILGWRQVVVCKKTEKEKFFPVVFVSSVFV